VGAHSSRTKNSSREKEEKLPLASPSGVLRADCEGKKGGGTHDVEMNLTAGNAVGRGGRSLYG